MSISATEFDSLRLSRIAAELGESKTRFDHYGLKSQRDNIQEPTLARFEALLASWDTPWDEEQQEIYQFKRQNRDSLRARLAALPTDSHPPYANEIAYLDAVQVQALIDHNYLIQWSNKSLELRLVFPRATITGLPRDDVIHKCGQRAWQEIVQFSYRKRYLWEARDILDGERELRHRFQFNSYIDNFIREDYWTYCKCLGLLAQEQQRIDVEQQELEDEIVRQRQRLHSISHLKQLNQQQHCYIRKRRAKQDPGLLQQEDALMEDLQAAQAAYERETEELQQQLTEAAIKNRRARLIHEAQGLQKQRALIARLSLRQRLESCAQEIQRINQAIERMQQRLRAQEVLHVQTQEEAVATALAQLRADILVLQQRLGWYQGQQRGLHADWQRLQFRQPFDPPIHLRDRDENEYAQFTHTLASQQLEIRLSERHLHFARTFDEIKASIQPHIGLLTYSCENLHQHHRLRLRVWRDLISVGKTQFEKRVGGSVWRRIINFFKNLFFGRISTDVKATFRERYYTTVAAYHDQRQQWADAVIARFNARENAHHPEFFGCSEYADVAINFHEDMRAQGIPFVHVNLTDAPSSCIQKGKYRFPSQSDLTPEMMVTLRSDLDDYLQELTEDRNQAYQAMNRCTVQKPTYQGYDRDFYRERYEDYQRRLRDLQQRLQAVPSQRPIESDEPIDQQHILAQRPEIRIALHGADQLLTQQPNPDIPAIQQLSHDGSPLWLAAGREQLLTALRLVLTHRKYSHVDDMSEHDVIATFERTYDFMLVRSNTTALHICRQLNAKLALYKETVRQYKETRLLENIIDLIDRMHHRITDLTQPCSNEWLFANNENLRRAFVWLHGQNYPFGKFYCDIIVERALTIILTSSLNDPDSGEGDLLKRQRFFKFLNECVDPRYRHSLLVLHDCCNDYLLEPEKVNDAIAILPIAQVDKDLVKIELCQDHIVPKLNEHIDIRCADFLHKVYPQILQQWLSKNRGSYEESVTLLEFVLTKSPSLHDKLPWQSPSGENFSLTEPLLTRACNILTVYAQFTDVSPEDCLDEHLRKYVSTEYNGKHDLIHQSIVQLAKETATVRVYLNKRIGVIIKSKTVVQVTQNDLCLLEDLASSKHSAVISVLAEAMLKWLRQPPKGYRFERLLHFALLIADKVPLKEGILSLYKDYFTQRTHASKAAIMLDYFNQGPFQGFLPQVHLFHQRECVAYAARAEFIPDFQQDILNKTALGRERVQQHLNTLQVNETLIDAQKIDNLTRVLPLNLSADEFLGPHNVVTVLKTILWCEQQVLTAQHIDHLNAWLIKFKTGRHDLLMAEYEHAFVERAIRHISQLQFNLEHPQAQHDDELHLLRVDDNDYERHFRQLSEAVAASASLVTLFDDTDVLKVAKHLTAENKSTLQIQLRRRLIAENDQFNYHLLELLHELITAPSNNVVRLSRQTIELCQIVSQTQTALQTYLQQSQDGRVIDIADKLARVGEDVHGLQYLETCISDHFAQCCQQEGSTIDKFYQLSILLQHALVLHGRNDTSLVQKIADEMLIRLQRTLVTTTLPTHRCQQLFSVAPDHFVALNGTRQLRLATRLRVQGMAFRENFLRFVTYLFYGPLGACDFSYAFAVQCYNYCCAETKRKLLTIITDVLDIIPNSADKVKTLITNFVDVVDGLAETLYNQPAIEQNLSARGLQSLAKLIQRQYPLTRLSSRRLKSVASDFLLSADQNSNCELLLSLALRFFDYERQQDGHLLDFSSPYSLQKAAEYQAMHNLLVLSKDLTNKRFATLYRKIPATSYLLTIRRLQQGCSTMLSADILHVMSQWFGTPVTVNNINEFILTCLCPRGYSNLHLITALRAALLMSPQGGLLVGSLQAYQQELLQECETFREHAQIGTKLKRLARTAPKTHFNATDFFNYCRGDDASCEITCSISKVIVPAMCREALVTLVHLCSKFPSQDCPNEQRKQVYCSRHIVNRIHFINTFADKGVLQQLERFSYSLKAQFIQEVSQLPDKQEESFNYTFYFQVLILSKLMHCRAFLPEAMIGDYQAMLSATEIRDELFWLEQLRKHIAVDAAITIDEIKFIQTKPAVKHNDDANVSAFLTALHAHRTDECFTDAAHQLVYWQIARADEGMQQLFDEHIVKSCQQQREPLMHALSIACSRHLNPSGQFVSLPLQFSQQVDGVLLQTFVEGRSTPNALLLRCAIDAFHMLYCVRFHWQTRATVPTSIRNYCAAMREHHQAALKSIPRGYNDKPGTMFAALDNVVALVCQDDHEITARQSATSVNAR